MGISIQQLEPIGAVIQETCVLKFAADQFSNNGLDYKQFIEVLQEHPMVKK